MKSDAQDVDGYLEAIELDRREAMRQVRAVIRDNLPDGYVESMTWGMPTYEVPLATLPKTYNGKPLAYASFAAQKKHFSIYLTALYSDSEKEREFRERWSAPSGKALDMGKSCVRFTTLDHADMPLIGESIGWFEVDDFIAVYERMQAR